MANPYNPFQQSEAIEAKITIALEKISEAFKVLLWKVGNEYALSPIQIRILIFLLHHPSKQGKVSYLAVEFNLTKATVSDSVKILEQKGLVTKNFDEEDTRSHSLILTKEGKNLARKLPEFSNPLEESIKQLPSESKQQLFEQLLVLVNHLQQSNIISLQRMCFQCNFYKMIKDKHYCNFLQKTLKSSEIRLDCPEHLPIVHQI